MRTIVAVAALAACSGDKTTDTGLDPNLCSQLVTQPLGSVPATDWPAGVTDDLPLYEPLSGRYQVNNSCGDALYVKFTAKTQEDLNVVTTPYPEGAGGCGCTVDPVYGDDSQYDPVLTHDGFQFYVESWDDPGLSSQVFVGEGALFGPDQPMQFRSCGVQDVNPALNSAYDTVATIARLEGGELTASIVMTPFEGDPVVCDLSGFSKVE
jgi:hypothetical protein